VTRSSKWWCLASAAGALLVLAALPLPGSRPRSHRATIGAGSARLRRTTGYHRSAVVARTDGIASARCHAHGTPLTRPGEPMYG
jgi:hypothetical protein